MRPDTVEAIYRLTPVQEGMLFHTLERPGAGVYLVQLVARLSGELDPDAFAAAWRSLVERHPVLRTSFHWQGIERPTQVVHRRVVPPWRQVDARGLDDGAWAAELERLRAAERERGFDLERPPLLRAVLARRGERDWMLVATFHHLLLDGWSLPLVFEELLALYHGRRPPRSRPFQDYVAWRERHLGDDGGDIWKSLLAGADLPTPLPSLPSATPAPSVAGETAEVVEVPVALEPAVAERLAAFARRHRVTLSTVFQGLWGLLLARAAGRERAVLGVTTSGRSAPLPGIERMVGLFINTLPLAVDGTGERPVGDWLREIQERHSLLVEREHDALTDVRRWAGVPSGRPLFESILVFENYPLSRLEDDDGAAGGLEVEFLPGVDRIDAPLALVVYDGRPPRAKVKADGDRIGRPTATALAARLAALVELLAAPGADARTVADLPSPTAEEARLLERWSRPAAGPETAVGEPFLARWRHQVETNPEAPALAWEETSERPAGSWNRGELARRVDRLAAVLGAAGVTPDGPERLVGVVVPRSPEQVVAVVATLAAGGALVPLEPTAPPERLAAVVADARPDVLVGEAATVERLGLGGVGGPVVSLEATVSGPPPRRAVDPRRLAYVLHTSGSTGGPKGVAVSHGALARRLDWLRATHPLGDRDTALAKTPVGFDVGLRELLWPLATGARLVLARPGAEADPRHLVRLAARERPAVLAAVPSLLGPLAEVVEELRAAGEIAADDPRIGRLLSGGETLAVGVARQLASTLPDTELWNQYGPTEVTVTATAHRVEATDDPVPVGHPIDGATGYVLDAAGRLAFPGAPGELAVGGPALARGYLGRPAATAEAFVPDPFGTGVPGARLYRTGDLVRHRADGALVFLGRIDSQVQVRGLRVELEEVEAVVASHPAVAACAVTPTAPSAPSGGEAGMADGLVAWVVPSSDGGEGGKAAAGSELPPGLAREVREHAARRLPAPAVPVRFLTLDALPRTATLKLDRRALAALPTPELPAAPAARRTAPSVDPLVEILADLWADVLELPPGSVAAGTSFFDLGGHSLTAVRLASRLASRLDLDLPLAVLLDHPTPGSAAAWVRLHGAGGARGGGDAPLLAPLPALEPGAGDGPMPLTFGQERFWFLDRLGRRPERLHIPFALELAGDLLPAALARALAQLVARHQVLRTRYPATGDGRPEQVVDPAPGNGAAALAVVDLSALPVARCDGAAQAARKASARRPFDLASGPVARSFLARLGEGRHQLAVTVHHIATDGWSTHLLVTELAALYRAAVAGTAPALPEPSLQMVDVARWQRRVLVGEALESRLEGWRRLLDGGVPALELPLDRPRGTAATDAVVVPVRLEGAALERVDAFARSRGATRFVLLATLFGALVGRWAGGERFGLGVPVAGRHRLETERMPGLFVNTLVLPVDRADRPSLATLARRLRDDLFAALALQDLPFETLVAELAPATDRGAGNPLFQVAFTFQNTPGMELALPGVRVRPLETVTGAAQFDLSLGLTDADDAVEGALVADGALFDRATVERLVAAFGSLVAAATAEPKKPLDDLPLLDAAARAELLAEGTGRRSRGEAVDPWTAIARRWSEAPEETVLTWEAADHRPAGSWTGAELAARVSGLARVLREHGVSRDGPESRVGIVLPRSPEQVVAVLATLAAGGAFLPLDPGLPPERLAAVATDGRPDVLVGDERTVQSAGLDRLGTPVVEPDAPSPDVPGGGVFEGEIHPDRLAYVLHTSGSTGAPKGVAVPRGALARRLAWLGRVHPLAAGDTALAKTPLTFDVGVRELLWPLAVGARLVLTAPGVEADPRRLALAAARQRPAVLAAVPSLLGPLADAVEELRRAGELGADQPRIGRLLSGGETLTPSLARRLAEVLPETVLWNQYGPTEVTFTATAHPVGSGVDEPVPIGRALDDATVRVVDPRGRLVLPGAVGELLVGGPALARGYLGRPRATAERFVPDPYTGGPYATDGRPGARLYRTGDLVRRRPDGALMFLGRIDSQVQVRGLRVELSEVEAVLASHPDVAECAVVPVASADGAPGRADHLVAWVVPTGGGVAGTEWRTTLAEHAAARLPAPAVPSRFIELSELPRTASLKIDRRSLAGRPVPALADEPGRTTPAPGALDPLVEILTGLWAEVLDAESVGPRADFFELGGHSLTAVRLASRIASRLGREIPLAALLEHPSPTATAAWLAAHPEGDGPRLAKLPPVTPRQRPDDGPLPLTSGQERLWFLDRLSAGGAARAAYHVPFALELSGVLDVPALGRALGWLVGRHEVLRTRYPERDGVPVQVIEAAADHPAARLSVVDLAGLAPPVGEAAAAAARRGVAREPFHLATGPVVRAVVLRLAPARHQLAVTVHHIATDGWSTHLLVTELAALYRAALEGATADPLSPPRLQVADVALWQRRELAGEALDERLRGWRRLLGEGLPALELPADRPRSGRPGPAVAVPVRLHREVSERLDRLVREHGVTRFVAFAALFGALVGRWAGSDRFGLGVPVAGRHRLETERVPGFFVDTLVLPLGRSDGPSLATLARRLRDDLLTALSLQDLPFERLVAELAPASGRAAGHPLFQVAFTLQNTPVVSLDLAGLEVERLAASTGAAHFDLSLGLVEPADGGGVEGALVADGALLDRSTIERLAGAFERLTQGATAAPAEALDSVELLSQDERVAVLAAGEGPPSQAPPTDPWMGISRRFRTAPEATALSWEAAEGRPAGSWTGAELAARVSSLARALREHGVTGDGPENRVGIVLPRSPEQVVAVLATLAAGGAFLPLDPGLPPERLAAVVNDGRPDVLVGAAETVERLGLATGLPVLSPDASPIGGEGATFDHPVHPARLAYVLHTSGSTGSPKGVAVPRGALARRLAWLAATHPLGEPSGSGGAALAKTPLTFDVGVRELLWPLAVGARLVLAAPGVEADPRRLVLLAARERPAVLAAVPSLLGPLADAVEELRAEGTLGADEPAIGRLLSGGETLPAHLARRLAQVLPGTGLWNQYGPTEVTVTATAHPVDSGVDEPVPIGRPLADTSARVLDPRGRLVLPGSVGELAVGGPAVARGYLGRPRATAERFVPDPFAAIAGARLYRTGDLVRQGLDGALLFRGRADSQVQVRGLRVELEEVEAVLSSHPGVAECAVVPVGEAGGRADRLVAWVVAADGVDDAGPEPATALAEHAAARLPAQAVPSRFVLVAELPRTASLKVDRRALARRPLPEPAGGAGPGASVSPGGDPLVEILAGLWAQVLGAGEVGSHSDLFEMGGHSLTAVRLASRISTRLGREIPLAALLDHPTPAATAAWLAAHPDGDRPHLAKLPPVGPRERRDDHDGPLPLTFGQERLWFLERLSAGGGGRAAYHVPFALELDGTLDALALARALGWLVGRHEVLRTRYPDPGESDGGPVQVIEAAAGHPAAELPVVDLSALGAPAADRAAEAARRRLARRPFDLERGPVVRSGLLRLGPELHHLAVTVHHIATDGWSTHLLVTELAALYQAALEGATADPLPAPRLQVADVALWQRRELVGEALDERLRGWRRLLGGSPPALDLPTIRRRSSSSAASDTAVPPAKTAVVVRLDPAVTERLDAFARSRGATRYVVLAALFGELLGRWSGALRFGLGAPVAGRHRLETERVPGFFVNTLVLPVDRSGRPSLGELAGRLRDDLLTALALQDVPFEKLVTELAPAAERTGRNPLFQVAFTFQNAPAVDLELPGIRVSPLDVSTEEPHFDLSMALGDAADGAAIAGSLAGDRRLFDPQTVERLARGFERLVDLATAAPDQPLGSLSLVAPDDRALLLDRWSGRPAEPAGAPPVDPWTAISRRLRAVPGETALAWEAADDRPVGSWSGAELASRVAALARALSERGVSADGPERRVGVVSSRSPEQVVAVLATLAAGGAFLPLDPTLPPARLAAVVADGQPDVLVGDRATIEHLGLHRAGAAVVAPDDVGSGDGRVEAFDDPGDPARLAYVLHTSGSTGSPKGVAVPRGALARRLAWLAATHPLGGPAGAGGTALAKTPLTFDVGVRELLWPLAAGARLVLAAPGAEADPRRLARLAARERPAVLAAVPSLLGPLADAVEELRGAGELGADEPAIGRLLSGGETLSPSLARRLVELLPETVLWNQYGPTEVTITATAHRVDPAVDGLSATVPIGRPIDGASAVVLDPAGALVPPGGVGELAVGGPALARGYLGRPRATAERFVPDPYTEVPGARLYRTGDLVRHRQDGALLFLGRADGQVQVRGLRVELEEVEAVLASHPGVAECAVVPVASADGAAGRADRLVAWVVPADGGGSTGGELPQDLVAALREHAARSLPGPAVPASFAVLAELPRTASLKVDRRALAERPQPAAAPAAGPTAPTLDPVLRVLLDLWAQVLDLDPTAVAPDSHFFDLGGHSLSAVRLASRIRQRLDREIPLAALLDHPTPAATAAWLAAHGDTAAELPPLPAIEPRRRGEDGGALPLTFGQERLWFLDRLLDAAASYHVPFGLGLDGPVSPRALARALGWLVDRHEVLRTRYPETETGPVQAIDPPGGDPAGHPVKRLPVVDLTGLDPERRPAAARRALRRGARRPFDLEAGPVLRAFLVRLGPDRHQLGVTVHHIATDGWSTHLLVTELAPLYRAAAAGASADPLPPPRLQVADVALWQRRHLDGAGLARRVEGWRKLLGDGVPPLALPTDRPRRALDAGPDPEDRPHPRGSVTAPAHLGPSVMERLDGFARQRGATRFVVLAAVFGALLGRWSGTLRFGLGVPVAGRHRLETERVPGFFVNTLVLPVERGDDPSLETLSRRLRDDLTTALALQDLPFEKLVAELAPAGDRSGRNPLFQVAFTLQNTPTVELELPEVAVERLAVGTGAAQFDLSLGLVELPDGAVTGGLTADLELFDRATVEALARSFERLVAAAVERPRETLAALPLVSAEERAQLLGEMSGRGVAAHGAGGEGQTLLDLFTDRLRLTPEAAALLVPGDDPSEATPVTYRQLGDHAARVAARLAAAGVARGEVVALVAERGPALLAGVLGVFGAGAAFLPVPPATPPERALDQLDDAGVRLVLAPAGVTAADLPGRSSDRRVVSLGAEAEPGDLPDAAAGALVRVPIESDDLAYVLYTSGSTGRPKGVRMHHRGPVAHVRWVVEHFRMDTGAPVLWKASLVFDPVLREIFGPFVAGVPILVAPPGAEGDPVPLLELVRAHGVEILSYVPSLLGATLDALDDAGEAAGSGSLGAVRQVISDGERLPRGLAGRLLGVLGRTAGAAGRLTNQLGPTETAVASTYRDFVAGETLPDRVGVGRPVPGHTAYLVDDRLHLVPLGAAGELLVGGVGVAEGYGRRPGLTAERFVPDPFSGVAGGRLYRTGDLLRRATDPQAAGELQFLGRIDRQLKLRGVRIEPGEIEAVLAEHPAVAEAAVVVAGESLVALVLPEAAAGARLPADEIHLPTDEILGHARLRLPDTFVPALLLVVDELPRNPSGKVDRRRVADLAAERLAAAREQRTVIEPRDDDERAIAALWRDLLDVERPSVDDGFFALGGHSLLLTRLRSRIARELGVELPLAALFADPTLAGMARALAAGRRRRDEVGAEATPGPGSFEIRAVPRAGRRLTREQLAALEDDEDGAAVPLGVGDGGDP